jgi:hypothetical protein
MIIGLPKPQITDSDSWWTGRNRIATFSSYQEALEYWEMGDVKNVFTLNDVKKAFEDGRKYEAGELELDTNGMETAFNSWVKYYFKK